MVSKFLCLFAAATSLVAADTTAPVTTGNNPAIKYRAVLPDSSTTPIRGAISGHGSNNTDGIIFNINFTGFPVEGGPYLYHIHEKPVPADGNCTGTGAHLDPYNRTETPACDANNPATCQVGDLSGKHGKPLSGTYELKYRDMYVSSIPGTPAFFGNRSVVVHNKDKVRLTCANFTLVEHASGGGGGSGQANGTYTAPPPGPTGGSGGVTSTATATTTGSASTGSAIVTGGTTVNGVSAGLLLLSGLAMML